MAANRRSRGAIRRRGRSYQVIVYSGIDPLTGRKIYLRESNDGRGRGAAHPP